MKNKIHLDYASNQDLAALLSSKKAGEKCTIEVTFQVDEVDEKHIVGTIEKVTAEGDDEKAAEPEPDKPMMIDMRSSGKKKKADPEVEEAEGMGY